MTEGDDREALPDAGSDRAGRGHTRVCQKRLLVSVAFRRIQITLLVFHVNVVHVADVCRTNSDFCASADDL